MDSSTAARASIGAALLLLLAGAAIAGIWWLRGVEGGGVPFVVQFEEAGDLETRSNVLYGDRIVGRVLRIDDFGEHVEVHAVLASEHAGLLRKNSAFWVQDPVGAAFLQFSNPLGKSEPAGSGYRYMGLEERPEPEVSQPRDNRIRIADAPGWLVDVEVVITARIDAERAQQTERFAAGAVVERRQGGSLLVLAPSWLVEIEEGAQAGAEVFVLFRGGERRRGVLKASTPGLCVIWVEASGYDGGSARFLSAEPAIGEAVLAVDFRGEGFETTYSEVGIKAQSVSKDGAALLDIKRFLRGFVAPGPESGVITLKDTERLIEETSKAVWGR